jgi:hypothetical protein
MPLLCRALRKIAAFTPAELRYPRILRDKTSTARDRQRAYWPAVRREIRSQYAEVLVELAREAVETSEMNGTSKSDEPRDSELRKQVSAVLLFQT